MYHVIRSLRSNWSKRSAPSRVWFSALASVSLATGLITASAATSDAASANPAAAPSSTGNAGGSRGAAAATPAVPSMDDQSGMGAISGPGSGSGQDSMGNAPMGGSPMGGTPSSAPGFCPNLTGTTVMSDGMVMAPIPSGPPTPAQQAAANALVAHVSQDMQAYSNLSVAEADGYRPASSTKGPSTHYLNPPSPRPKMCSIPPTRPRSYTPTPSTARF